MPRRCVPKYMPLPVSTLCSATIEASGQSLLPIVVEPVDRGQHRVDVAGDVLVVAEHDVVVVRVAAERDLAEEAGAEVGVADLAADRADDALGLQLVVGQAIEVEVGALVAGVVDEVAGGEVEP